MTELQEQKVASIHTSLSSISRELRAIENEDTKIDECEAQEIELKLIDFKRAFMLYIEEHVNKERP